MAGRSRSRAWSRTWTAGRSSVSIDAALSNPGLSDLGSAVGDHDPKLVGHVDVLLRERDADTLGVETLLDLASDVPEDVPVVGRLGPGAGDEVD